MTEILVIAPSGIDLHTFPSDDNGFRDFALAELAALVEPDSDRLQHRLRAHYPLAIVSVRSSLASVGQGAVVWYAFRRAVGSPPGDRWWANAPAHAVLGPDGAIAEATNAFATIAELPVAAMIGRGLADFTNPADVTAADDIAALWAELQRLGSVYGTIRFNRLDGTPREVEYHAAADGAGSGRYRLVIRER